MPNFAQALALVALEIRAIKLSPKQPFTWASGYRMPIYNDNRMLLGDYKHRALVADGFVSLIAEHKIDFTVVAGTVTAGISPGTTLADRTQKPFIYVRDKAEGHGLQNRIEGILKPGERVLMIEDLISTGGSVISAIEGVRDAGGVVDYCFSIFSYGFEEAQKQFADIGVNLLSVLTFPDLLACAKAKAYISEEEEAMLADWRKDPFNWGEKNGFPKVEK